MQGTMYVAAYIDDSSKFGYPVIKYSSNQHFWYDYGSLSAYIRIPNVDCYYLRYIGARIDDSSTFGCQVIIKYSSDTYM